MSVNRRNTRRSSRKKKFDEPYSIIASTKMLGIAFANDISDIVDTTERLTVNPSVTLRGTKAIFDYGHLTNQDDIDAINYLFQNVLSVDDLLTVSDATHVNPIEDSNESDLSGTYTFSKYDSTSRIAILNQVSINNKSSVYDRYDYKYFTNKDTLKFTTESTQIRTEERRIILNLLGADSENSFLLGFREMHVGDLISVQGVKGDFTVVGYRINSKGYEEIEVKEPVDDTDLFGESTLVTIKRRVSEDSNERLFYPPEDTDTDENDVPESEQEVVTDRPVPPLSERTPSNSNQRNNRQIREQPSGIPRPTGERRSSPVTFRNNRETSKIESAKEAWLDSPRENIYVRVVKNKEGKNVYEVKGNVTGHKWTRKVHTLVAGQPYRFVQTDRSNKGHPLRFSLTPDGTHSRVGNDRPLSSVPSNKTPGSSSSYVYFTVPGVLPNERVHIYCANHSGMGMNFEVYEETTMRSTSGPMVRPIDPNDGPPVEPGGGTGDGDGLPVGPGQGRDDRRDWINTCCTETCIECLLDGIREKETGDPCQDGPSGIPNDFPPYCPTCLKDPCDGGGDNSSPCYGCNAIKKCDGCPKCPAGNTGPHQPCCRNNSGPSSPCWSCGPYMIKREYWDEARRACTGRPNSSAECCSIPVNWEGELCKKCEGTEAQIQACCKRKRDLSRLVMRCWWRFYTRNGRCQSGSGKCKGYPNPDGKCWTCKDLAQGHNGGPCRNANADYWPCRSGGHCGIKKALCDMGGECDDCCDIKTTCRSNGPPELVPQDKSCCGGDCGESPDGPATEPDSTNPTTNQIRAFYD